MMINPSIKTIKLGMSIILVAFCLNAFAEIDKKTVLITGGAKGIGKEISQIFDDRNWDVWVTSRYIEDKQFGKNIKFVQVDLTDDASVTAAINKIYKNSGRLDVVVNNAGYGLLGAGESATIEQIKNQFDVNFYGAIRVIQAVLPIMRQQRSGHIINVSSTSGVRAVPGLGFYAASKMALEGFSEALSAELSPWNIKVSIIQPATVNNTWVNNCVIGEKQIAEKYKNLSVNLRKTLLERTKTGQEQSEIGNIVVSVAENPNPNFRYQTSAQASDIAQDVYLEPSGNAMNGKMISFAKTLYGD